MCHCDSVNLPVYTCARSLSKRLTLNVGSLFIDSPTVESTEYESQPLHYSELVEVVQSLRGFVVQFASFGRVGGVDVLLCGFLSIDLVERLCYIVIGQRSGSHPPLLLRQAKGAWTWIHRCVIHKEGERTRHTFSRELCYLTGQSGESRGPRKRER
jgi:hypothetical protein